MSGKYAADKDPPGTLAKMVRGLELRALSKRAQDTMKQLKAAQQRGDAQQGRLYAELAVALGKGDVEALRRLDSVISSNRKQAE